MTTNTMKHIYKAGSQPEAPTLLLLHGTGGTENDLVGLAEMIAPGAGILGVRGNVSENGMPRFFRRLAEGVFDEEDLIARTAELGSLWMLLLQSTALIVAMSLHWAIPTEQTSRQV